MARQAEANEGHAGARPSRRALLLVQGATQAAIQLRTAVEAVENYFALGGRNNSQDVNEQQFVRKLQHVWQQTSRRADERLPIACARLGEC